MRGKIAVAIGVVALCLAPIAAGADIGANDDTGKFAADGGTAFYGQMASLGLKETVITVRFKPSEPDVIQDKLFLDQAIPTAILQGVKVVLAIYPYPPRELATATPAAFAAYATLLAETYPGVRQYVVGNEPNQTAFWRPQLDRKGRNLSAPRFGAILAAAYDALKAVDPEIEVVGVGLSPRGNDNSLALSNVSTSPVRFIGALGRWYRASGRKEPLMDGFSYHPYPQSAKDAPTRAYAWPNAGFADLARIKQALWDAFDGTAQPTTVDGLSLYLDEVGWQVATAGLDGYSGVENVPVTTEARQASIYASLVRRAACDRDIAQVNFFGFYDDALRGSGFQSALHRVDGTARPAASAVSNAIRTSRPGGPACRGVRAWHPSTSVAGATMTPPLTLRSGTLRVLVGAKEGAVAMVCLIPSTRARTLAASSSRSLASVAVGDCWQGRLTPRQRIQVKLHVPPGWRGKVAVASRIAAELNVARTVLQTATP
jgi:hypothetical protein